MWSVYLGAGASAAPSVLASPAAAAYLAGLPATFVATSDHDPLRDAGLTYAQRLVQADVSVELHNYARAYHVLDLAAPTAKVSQQALADQVRFLSRTVGEQRP